MENTSKTTDLLSILVRSLGLIMLIIGLYIGIKVIFEAWKLYEEPQRIERLADAIDNGSHLDNAISSITSSALDVKPSDDSVRAQVSNADDSLRVSYFLAWFLAVLLLLIISGLAMSAIKTGGQLALYDLEVKRFARQLIEEARKTDND
jgi:disulfide bond formation protein DsbB